jgi:heme/copper-type cytochrome/quinol oxidase subunit 2
MKLHVPAAVLIGLFAAHTAAAATPAEPFVVALTLKDHRFTPDKLTVPAGRRIRIDLTNQDAALEEFDSEALHVEKDVAPHGRVSFTVGPLQPGSYPFMGELHPDTAAGVITAAAAP